MDIPSTTPISSPRDKTLDANTPAFVPVNVLKATAGDFSPPLRKEFYGAVVEFGPGGAVISTKLAADSCTIQIKGLCETTPGTIQTVLDILGLHGSTPSIVTIGTSTGSVTTVTFDDPSNARLAVENFAASQRDSKVTVSHIVTLTTPSEWVQLGGLKCSWEKTGCMAFIEYRSDTPRLEEIDTAISQLLTPSGRQIKCTLIAANGYETQRGLRSFSVNNLDTDADATWVQSSLIGAGIEAPKKVKIQKIENDGVVDDDECVKVIQRYLRTFGLLDSFSSGETLDGARKIVTAIFCNPANAQDAVAEFKVRYPAGFPATKNLTLERFLSIKVNIPSKMAAALDSEIQAFRIEVQRDGKDKLKIVKDDEKLHTIVRFSAVGGDAFATVVKTKARLEKIMAGTVVTDNGVPVWHSWFGSSEGARSSHPIADLFPNFGDYLHWLSWHTKVYVHRSTDKGHLILYGGTYNDRRRACSILKSKIQELKRASAYTIRPVPGKSFAEILDHLSPVFGEKVRLSVADGPPKIKLCGSVADIRKARHILYPGTQPKGGDCVFCYDTPGNGNAIHLACGHNYCQECFVHQFKNPNEYSLPLKCCGLSDTRQRCTHRIDLGVLREHLSFTEFESVLKLSIDVHIRTHPNDYKFCSTPDCEVIFRRAKIEERHNPPLTTCSGCLQTYDTFCGKYHPEYTCKEYLDIIDGTDAFSRYCAAAGIKNCPGCQAPAEKFEGCNHVLCTRCHAHYCWVCLMILPSQGATYNHLTETHGGIGIPDGIPPQYLPQDMAEAANALDEALHLPAVFNAQQPIPGNPPGPGNGQLFQAPIANMDNLRAIIPGEDVGAVIDDFREQVNELERLLYDQLLNRGNQPGPGNDQLFQAPVADMGDQEDFEVNIDDVREQLDLLEGLLRARNQGF
ncbi:hypothetical protein IFR05_003786 [Cadophora sp. M221]|nr:hypothetical protein IFR05_003786 [Cadophora sp. M221]